MIRFSKAKLHNIILLMAVLIGIFVRLYGLDIQGFWFDELAVVYPMTSKTSAAFSELILSDLHPPLYPLILYYWVKIMGSSEIIIRLPSAIAGILSIFAMYFLGKKVLNHKGWDY